MPDLTEQVTNETPPMSAVTEMTDNITSAPGDLPVPEIEARILAQQNQFRHDNILIPSAPQAGQAVEIWATSGENYPLERSVLFYTTDGSLPDTSSMTLPLEKVRVDWETQVGYLTRWRAILPAQTAHTIVRYRIGGWYRHSYQEEPDVWAQDGQGHWYRQRGLLAVTTFAYTVEAKAPHFPQWTQDGIIYQIFVDRFRTSEPGGDFPHNPDLQALHGGTLQGVIDALPYLADLGVTCLWLSPIHQAETYHRYDGIDFNTVDPRLGTNEDVKELTQRAHAQGMRVILDFVPSHVSWHHPAFLEAQQNQDAESADWFTFYAWPDNYRSFLDMVPSLPSFSTESRGARRYIFESAITWLKDYGIDGFRLDHAIGHSMDFWTEFRQVTRAVAPESITVGEVTDTPDSMARFHGKLDGLLDFPLASALRHTFGIKDWNVQKLDTFLYSYEQFMMQAPERVSFLDNHDMNRFLFVANQDTQRLKMAALCQFTLTATPVIYYGTEVGMSHSVDIGAVAGGDALARQDMPWTTEQWNQDLLSFYRSLIQIRKAFPVLRQGKRRTMHLNVAQKAYAYAQTSIDADALIYGDILVTFNLSNTQQTLLLPKPGKAREYTCLLATCGRANARLTAQGIEITLPAQSGAAFTPVV
ncbi:alpha-amylase family glycosyl hydrolase [Ktedonobacter racemifer]|uniref:Alpha amylase catalytic region n=1 Tax=Ktedonobacter racemifer DSM 44963 TaxID=485913 RepID=D6U1J2_KTERA|nr:alpha-amylase family glycosyl hydrolase [Ktedonobacter racemifer]EFH82636.1 alpha amylase catalytic region [Ktedonobacter racemifer DSM 44963]